MGLDVDKARGDRQPRSVDDPRRVARQRRGDAGDPTIRDRDVGTLAPFGTPTQGA